VSAIQAARAAAALEREFGVEVTLVDGRYGELSVVVDDEEVVAAGPLGFLGVLPTLARIRSAVAKRLRSPASGDPHTP